MSEPTAAAGLDYETPPNTRAGQQLVSTYTILTPFVRRIEVEARAAALDAWMPVWRALQAACADCRSPGESRTVNGFSCPRHRPLYLAAIDALRERSGE